MNNELDKIILGLKETIRLTKLKITDEDKVVLENAIKIFISNNINNSKNGFVEKALPEQAYPKYPYKNRFEKGDLKGEQNPNEKPTEKQIKFLNMNKVKVPNTKREAFEIISKIKKREKEESD